MIMNRQKGFTLIEVMIAITIFAMLATTISQVAAVTVDSQLHLEKKLIASWIAENEIITLRSVSWAEIKKGKKDISLSDRDWIIEIKVKDKKNFAGMPIPLEVKEVTVSVYLKDDNDTSLQTFTAYMANDDI